MKKKRTTAYIIGLLTIIAALLAVILVIFPGQFAAHTATEAEDYAAADGDVVEEPRPIPADQQETEVHPQAPPKEKRIYIVIDDVGNSLTRLEPFLDAPVAITFAIMPGRPYSEESEHRLRLNGQDVILHQPMEPVGSQDPGSGALLTGMSREQVFSTLKKNLSELPSAIGLNNHMGSKVTADVEVMKSVMSYIAERDLFFLDSVTTDKSVAEAAAVARGVDYARRNSLFLDNEPEREKIEKAFDAGLEVARRSGEVVMIGHVKSQVIVSLLKDRYRALQNEGFIFLGMSEYFDERG